MAGNRHTICTSDEALTTHLADATSTLGLAGPNPTPKIVTASPPVRLHEATLVPRTATPHPATPAMLGKEYETALGRVADKGPDCTDRAKAEPVPAGNVN